MSSTPWIDLAPSLIAIPSDDERRVAPRYVPLPLEPRVAIAVSADQQKIGVLIDESPRGIAVLLTDMIDLIGVGSDHEVQVTCRGITTSAVVRNVQLNDNQTWRIGLEWTESRE